MINDNIKKLSNAYILYEGDRDDCILCPKCGRKLER